MATRKRLFWRVRRAEPPADLEIWSQDAFKNGAGTASSPRLFSSAAFYGDTPSPPRLTRFPEPTLVWNGSWSDSVLVVSRAASAPDRQKQRRSTAAFQDATAPLLARSASKAPPGWNRSWNASVAGVTGCVVPASCSGERARSVQRCAFTTSLPVLRHESRLRCRQIRVALSRQQRPVNPHVAHEHVEPLLQRLADNLAGVDILLIRE